MVCRRTVSFYRKPDHPRPLFGIQMPREILVWGWAMAGFLLRAGFEILLAGSVLAGMTHGQAAPVQKVVSAPAAGATSDDNAPQPAENSDAAIDPASLIPDLPQVRPTKASLIGGTIAKLDRVRDRMTVQLFGGGKMIIAFDPRTNIFQDGVKASVSDLQRGDRIYIDTILDGGMVFARTIRLKTANTAGESQGTVVGYRSDKSELLLRDLLSPRDLKIRLTSQTSIVDSGHTASASELAPGTLVAVKFGPQQDGTDVAREVSVLAIPGASFSFAGTVTAVDLRLGLLVLNSSTDHKTYEISLDAATASVDNLRPGADVTVLSRFDGSHYVAQNVTVNPPDPR
jgi:hypothetical protein